jgi:hypothetical protein
VAFLKRASGQALMRRRQAARQPDALVNYMGLIADRPRNADLDQL